MSIDDYKNDIRKIPPISEEKKLQLIDEYVKTRSVKIRNKLVEQNLKLVFKVVSRYGGNHIDHIDLIAQGNLGLIHGVEKFDPNKGTKLSHYLFIWVNAYVLRYITNNAHLVKLGTTSSQRKLFFNLSKVKREAERTNNIKLSHEEIAQKLGVKVKEVKEMEERLSCFIYPMPDDINKNMDGERNINNTTMLSISQNKNLPDKLTEEKELITTIRKIKNNYYDSLKGVKREVFKSRYLNPNGPETLKAIGDQNNLTKQRIQQIDSKFLKDLKRIILYNKIDIT